MSGQLKVYPFFKHQAALATLAARKVQTLIYARVEETPDPDWADVGDITYVLDCLNAAVKFLSTDNE